MTDKEVSKQIIDNISQIILKLPWVPDDYSAVTLASSMIMHSKDNSITIYEMPAPLGGGYVVASSKDDKRFPNNPIDQLGRMAITVQDLTAEAHGIATYNYPAITKDKMDDVKRQILSEEREEKIEAFLKALALPHYLTDREALGFDNDTRLVLIADVEYGGGYFLGTEEELQPFLDLGMDIV